MSTDPPRQRSFIAELQRRNVPRAAVLYAGVVWAAAQGIAQLGPAIGAPGWATRAFLIAAAVGFPFWLVLAWIFEITPKGIQRESEIAEDDPTSRRAGRKLDFAIIAVLAVAVILLLGNQFVWHKGIAQSPSPQAQGVANIPQKSVAVLPFANESGTKDQQFFSDGLSDDLITALSQFAGLKVISRNSAFQFRDSKLPSAKIGELLGVSHLLEGSVQRAGDAVRITATLVNATDGTVLWTQRFDKPYKDLFALQDAITQAVADALKAKLMSAPGTVVQSDRPPGGNMDAYMAFLRARSRHGGTEAELRDAVKSAEEAIRLDPNYAAAYAELSKVWSILGEEFLKGEEMRAAYAKSLAAANAAIALDPDLAEAHVARAMVLWRSKLDFSGYREEMQRADRLEPNQPESVALSANDPGKPEYWFSRSLQLAAAGKLDEADKAQRTGISMQPEFWPAYMELLFIEVRRDDAAAAFKVTAHFPVGIWRDFAVALALQVGDDHPAADAALGKLIKLGNGYAAFQIAEVYAVRKDPDNMFRWLEHAWDIRDPGLVHLWSDPFMQPWRGDPRFIAFARKIGLPTADSLTPGGLHAATPTNNAGMR